MKRGEFIRLSILAALGVAVAPAIKLAEKLPPLPQKKVFAFKVSNELLQDKEIFDVVLNEQIKSLDGNGNLKELAIGFDGDDFIKNIHTVKLVFV